MSTVPAAATNVTPPASQEEGGAPPVPNQETGDPPAATEYVLWDGSLPAPAGKMAVQFSKTTVPKQTSDAAELLAFLSEESPDLAKLNVETRDMAALVNIPDSDLIKVVYGFGHGTCGVGSTSPIDGKIMVMTGDLDKDAPPAVLLLPSTCLAAPEVICPTDEDFVTKLQQTQDWPMFRLRGPGGETQSVSKLVPIPAYLVYDGFEKELKATEVFERVSSRADHDSDLCVALKNFLKSCMIQRRSTDDRTYVNPQTFMTTPPKEAKSWGLRKIQTVLKGEHQPAATVVLPDPPVTGTLAEILRRLSDRREVPPPVSPTTTDIETTGTLGMSPTELRMTLMMCGLQDGDEDLLPKWLSATAEKGQTDNTKNQVIIAALGNTIYDDAEITVHAALLQMIRKRKWLSDDPVASFRTAAKGLSPFAMLVSDDDAAVINDTMEALDHATTTTAAEYKAVTKVTATVPVDSFEFLLLLKTFANLLFALFGSSCPLYTNVRHLIKAIHTYKRSAIRALTMQTKASILWILLLQTRHFAAGHQTVLAEFQNMLRKIVAKESPIVHAEVPAMLLSDPPATSTKRKEPSPDSDTTPGLVTPDRGPPKRVKIELHPLIKSKIVDNIGRANRTASLTQICKFCDTDVRQLCRETNRCVLYMVGMCKKKGCTRKHAKASDAEAAHIVLLLDKAVQNPTEIPTEG